MPTTDDAVRFLRKMVDEMANAMQEYERAASVRNNDLTGKPHAESNKQFYEDSYQRARLRVLRLHGDWEALFFPDRTWQD